MKKNTKKNTVNQTVGNLAVKEEPIITQPDKPDNAVVSALLANSLDVNGAKYCTLPVSMLETDYYQRPIQNQVRSIAANWDYEHAGVIRVNYRDGRLYVMDGQNRVEAAKLLNIPMLMCIVSVGKTCDEEIDVFVNQDDNVTRMSTYDRFHALCQKTNDPFVSGMKALFDKYHVVYANQNAGQKHKGKTISRTPSTGTSGRLGGIATILKTGENCGLEMVDTILSMIQELGWHTLRNAYSSTILSALEYAFKGRDAIITKDKLYRALNAKTPDDVIIEARSQNRSVGRTAAVKALIDKIVQ